MRSRMDRCCCYMPPRATPSRPINRSARPIFRVLPHEHVRAHEAWAPAYRNLSDEPAANPVTPAGGRPTLRLQPSLASPIDALPQAAGNRCQPPPPDSGPGGSAARSRPASCPEPRPPGASCGGRREKRSCAWAPRAGSAQGTVPSALPASAAMFGRFGDPPDASIYQPRRGHPASLTAESVPRALKSRRWPAVMTPRVVGLRAAEAVASHRAADGAGPSIEAARTYAHGTSRGAVAAVSCAWPGWETAAGLVWAVWRREPVGESVGVQKLLRMGATRWLCSVHRPERSAWLDHHPRNLLAPARCADLPPAARAGGQHWPRRRSGSSQNAVLAGSDGAEAHRPVSGRCGGFAQSCERRRSFDRGRPDPCPRHHQGRCGRFARVMSANPCHSEHILRVASPTERLGRCCIRTTAALEIKMNNKA
jgi:hypothetical protein